MLKCLKTKKGALKSVTFFLSLILPGDSGEFLRNLKRPFFVDPHWKFQQKKISGWKSVQPHPLKVQGDRKSVV